MACAAEGNDIVLFDEAGSREVARFAFPRQAKEGGLCIADFLRDVDEPERDVLGLQVVTVGQRASEVAREWFADNRYQDYVRLHGLGVEMAEALAEYVHAQDPRRTRLRPPRTRATCASCSSRAIAARATASATRPARTSPTRRRCSELLGAERIGIELSEEDQLWPEQSTTAIVLHHPQARYFNV